MAVCGFVWCGGGGGNDSPYNGLHWEALWDVKEPSHCSQRVEDVVPGVVVWSLCVYSHGWVGKCSEILATLSYSIIRG